jgi:hypothetical protein
MESNAQTRSNESLTHFFYSCFYNPARFIQLIPLYCILLQTHAVAINPNGRNYASGAEDGYVRLHYFDKSYLDMKDPVPEADEEAEGEEEEAKE